MGILIALAGIVIGAGIVLLAWFIWNKLKKPAGENAAEPVQAEKKPEPVAEEPVQTVEETPIAEEPAVIAEPAAVVYEPAPVPVYIAPVAPAKKPIMFSLSRNDVLDYIEVMAGNPSRFPVQAGYKKKARKKLADSLLCGQRCFGLMYEYKGLVFNFVLRMSPETAKRAKERHSLKPSDFPGKNWYNLIVDRSFDTKAEVYRLLDECYDYVLNEFAQTSSQNLKAAEAEQLAIDESVAENLKAVAEFSLTAEEKYLNALGKYKADNYPNYTITRDEIAKDVRKKNEPDILAIERPEHPNLPISLRYKGKTYAMLADPKEGSGVLLTVRLDNAYGESLTEVNPEVCRARFPKGANWYYIPATGAYGGKKPVYDILEEGRKFIAAAIIIRAELMRQRAEERKAKAAELRAAKRK